MTYILFGHIDERVATVMQQILTSDEVTLLRTDNQDQLQQWVGTELPLVVFFASCTQALLKQVDAWSAAVQHPVLKVLLHDDANKAPETLPYADVLDDIINTTHALDARLQYLIQRARRRIQANQTALALQQSRANAHAVLNTTVDGIITIDEDRIIQSYNRAAEDIFGYSAEEVIGKNVNILMPPPFREEHDGYVKSYHETNHKKIIGIGREVRGLRKNGEIFPMELAVSEIEHSHRSTYTGIIRDISVRRELEEALLHASEEERRRIGQDLHDGLGQMLTGIGLIAKNLANSLSKQHPEVAQEVFELVDLVKSADQQARSISRSLIPIELENGGLKAAILRLGTSIERLYGIPCDYQETGSMPDISPNVKTHFFRIVQEAISNAAKHSKASRITTSVASSKDQLRAHIQDNGVGIDLNNVNGRGMGLRIMQHRANVIGASLKVRPGTTDGTTITCTLSLNT